MRLDLKDIIHVPGGDASLLLTSWICPTWSSAVRIPLTSPVL